MRSALRPGRSLGALVGWRSHHNQLPGQDAAVSLGDGQHVHHDSLERLSSDPGLAVYQDRHSSHHPPGSIECRQRAPEPDLHLAPFPDDGLNLVAAAGLQFGPELFAG